MFGVSHIFAPTSRHNPISAPNGKELPMFLVEREIVTELSHLATSLVLRSLFSVNFFFKFRFSVLLPD